MNDADLDDIRRTIRFWKRRGVIRDVASELHCRPDWSCIERRMVKLAMGWEIEELSRRAA